MKEQQKLTVKWSKKENDLLGAYPLGINTGRDLGYLFSFVFTGEFQREMQERGYDLKSMKFEITVDAINNPERFPTLHKQATQ